MDGFNIKLGNSFACIGIRFYAILVSVVFNVGVGATSMCGLRSVVLATRALVSSTVLALVKVMAALWCDKLAMVAW